MKVLFDQGTPLPLTAFLIGHAVDTVYANDWARLSNGELLAQAEAAGYDVFVTTDQQLQYQQNLSERRIAIVVLSTTSWPRIQANVQRAIAAVDGAKSGDYVGVDF